ncbi:MAG TPA: hypothetical protein VMW81_09680 [Nitrospinota bacterium]|nr:hypothetical protein [Nitrospinota bacterium]
MAECPSCKSKDVVKTAYGERWRCKKCGQYFKVYPSGESEKK